VQHWSGVEKGFKATMSNQKRDKNRRLRHRTLPRVPQRANREIFNAAKKSETFK